jgi:hypothetical protein
MHTPKHDASRRKAAIFDAGFTARFTTIVIIAFFDDNASFFVVSNVQARVPPERSAVLALHNRLILPHIFRNITLVRRLWHITCLFRPLPSPVKVTAGCDRRRFCAVFVIYTMPGTA